MKFWIGGVGKTATLCCVWAHLMVKGESKGVHIFIVRIRERETHDLVPGVIAGDCGPKMGAHGIDNGFLVFDNFRVPKDALLDRFCEMKPDGTYHSDMEPDVLFGLSLGSFSSGRITLIAGGAKTATVATQIAIRYACVRR